MQEMCWRIQYRNCSPFYHPYRRSSITPGQINSISSWFVGITTPILEIIILGDYNEGIETPYQLKHVLSPQESTLEGICFNYFPPTSE